MINVKKNSTTLGQIQIAGNHPFSRAVNGFQISPRMQELMVYAGQLDCYGKSNEVMNQFLSHQISTAQIHRVTDTYGEQIGKTSMTDRTLSPLSCKDTMYTEVDGSMVFTREEGWKEVKVGRIFKGSDVIKADGKPGWIRQPQYSALLGNSHDFIDQMDEQLKSYALAGQQMVFISDGAVWIRNWIEDNYPKAISILDYYHACEYLHDFANSYFDNSPQKEQWVSDQKALLLESKVDQVIEHITELAHDNQTAKKIIAYYRANRNRMDYKRYGDIGCGIIGSGAIESAHRTVVQKRIACPDIRENYPDSDGVKKELKICSILG